MRTCSQKNERGANGLSDSESHVNNFGDRCVESRCVQAIHGDESPEGGQPVRYEPAGVVDL
ncbi:hypothetical protein DPMN_036718 [Dreissena polymorpha]|uniref:Uncharacterized protein n=1 Tax=Dreissena polymorpha TaxID=45954 RepID=A0A9D4MBC5_DREPO|nr:hypothetical protein DPMN_036718 [Dreissena polymorpha]